MSDKTCGGCRWYRPLSKDVLRDKRNQPGVGWQWFDSDAWCWRLPPNPQGERGIVGARTRACGEWATEPAIEAPPVYMSEVVGLDRTAKLIANAVPERAENDNNPPQA